MSTKATNPALSLYRKFVKLGKSFKDYNLRDWSVRKAKFNFDQHRNVQDPAKAAALLAQGHTELEVLRRQVLVNNLYNNSTYFIDTVPEPAAKK